MEGVSDHVRDLGPIEGHEIPPVGPAVTPPAAPSPPGRTNPPPPVPGPTSTDLVPVGPFPPPRPGSRVDAARVEAVEALRDIREAHRRGPKPNSRPLPNWVNRLAYALDSAIAVPGTGGRRIGVDGLLTFIPGIGDAAGLVLSMIVVTAGVAAGVSIPTILRMLINVGFESLAGLVPFAGAFFDMAYKANERNVRLIEADLADRKRTSRSSLALILAMAATIVVGFLMTVAIFLLSIAVFVWLVIRLFQ
jgi:hypothetical protein